MDQLFAQIIPRIVNKRKSLKFVINVLNGQFLHSFLQLEGLKGNHLDKQNPSVIPNKAVDVWPQVEDIYSRGETAVLHYHHNAHIRS